jgi:hypothetical protein
MCGVAGLNKLSFAADKRSMHPPSRLLAALRAFCCLDHWLLAVHAHGVAHSHAAGLRQVQLLLLVLLLQAATPPHLNPDVCSV